MKLHEYIEWMREDLAYKAPESWPGVLSQRLAFLVEHYPNVQRVDTPAVSE